MPIHDWTRVPDYVFHDFHLGWVAELSRRLNDRLPKTHFALSETLELRPPPGFLDMPEPEESEETRLRRHNTTIEQDEPGTRLVARRDVVEYANRVISIRDADTHVVVAGITIVSPQEKRSRYRWEAFVRHAVAALTHDINLLVVDLFPPTVRDPKGIHKAIWDEFEDVPFDPPADKPLTLVSYVARPTLTAYIEPVAVGDALPDMPLFLGASEYIQVPLETTYLATWAVSPEPIRELVEPAK
jgi:hypothetical protein